MSWSTRRTRDLGSASAYAACTAAAVVLLATAAWSVATRALNPATRALDRMRAESAAKVCAEAAALRRVVDPGYHSLPVSYPAPQPGQEAAWAVEASGAVSQEILPGGGACWPIARQGQQDLYGVGVAVPAPFGPAAYVVRARVVSGQIVLEPIGQVGP